MIGFPRLHLLGYRPPRNTYTSKVVARMQRPFISDNPPLLMRRQRNAQFLYRPKFLH